MADHVGTTTAAFDRKQGRKRRPRQEEAAPAPVVLAFDNIIHHHGSIIWRMRIDDLSVAALAGSHGGCAVVAGVLVVVGDLEHGRVAAVLLLDVLCGEAASVILVGAPEVAPCEAGAVDLLLAVFSPLVAVLVRHGGQACP